MADPVAGTGTHRLFSHHPVALSAAPMRRAITRLALIGFVAASALGGCALLKSAFTEPTGVITIERQDFIDTFALLSVLTEDFFVEADRACAVNAWPAATCAKLPAAKDTAAALGVAVRAKIAVPESRIDWDAVKELLGVLVSLRP